MATLTLSLSKKIDELGKSEIMIRFSVSQTQRYRIKSGFYISANRWTKKNEISIPKLETLERKELLSLDSKLKTLRKHIFTSFEHSSKSTVDKNWLIECIERFHFPEKFLKEEKPFFDFVEEYFVKRKMSDGRLRSVKVVFRILRRYELFKKKKDSNFTLKLSEFDENTLNEFEDYLMNEYKYLRKYPEIYKQVKESRSPKQRGVNTVNDKLKKLRSFFVWCFDNGITSQNPFRKFSINESVYGTPVYITVSERNKIYNHDFGSNLRLAIQKDVFVFQCLVGCREG